MLQEKAYIYQTIGSGLSSLWVQKNVPTANVQGANMLVSALPEAMGLQFVKENLDEKAAQLLIKKKTDKYAKEKNNEPNTEPTLLFADGTNYLEENKGAIALNDVINIIGKEKFNAILLNFVNINPEKPKRFIDLCHALLEEVPETKKQRLRKVFKTVNQF